MKDCKAEASARIKALSGDGWLACVRLCEENVTLEARATAAEERAKALAGYVRHGFREDGTPCESYGFPTPPPGRRCTCGLAALTGQEESRG